MLLMYLMAIVQPPVHAEAILSGGFDSSQTDLHQGYASLRGNNFSIILGGPHPFPLARFQFPPVLRSRRTSNVRHPSTSGGGPGESLRRKGRSPLPTTVLPTALKFFHLPVGTCCVCSIRFNRPRIGFQPLTSLPTPVQCHRTTLNGTPLEHSR